MNNINILINDDLIINDLTNKNFDDNNDDFYEIFYYISFNNYNAVYTFIKEKNDIFKSIINEKYKDFYGKTPLYNAVSKNNIDIVNLLVNNNVDINEQCTNNNSNLNKTALYCAIKKGYIDIVDYLLKNGANPNESYYKHYKPINIALHYFNIYSTYIINHLLYFKANVNNYSQKNFDYPLIQLCRKNIYKDDKMKICKFLIDFKSNINNENSIGQTPLSVCLNNNDHEIVDLLLSNKADINQQINQKNKLYTYPIHISLLQHDLKMIDILLFHKADVNVLNKNGYNVEEIYTKLYCNNKLLENKSNFSACQNNKFYELDL